MGPVPSKGEELNAVPCRRMPRFAVLAARRLTMKPMGSHE
jgi:hypothetical protein